MWCRNWCEAGLVEVQRKSFVFFFLLVFLLFFWLFLFLALRQINNRWLFFTYSYFCSIIIVLLLTVDSPNTIIKVFSRFKILDPRLGCFLCLHPLWAAESCDTVTKYKGLNKDCAHAKNIPCENVVKWEFISHNKTLTSTFSLTSALRPSAEPLVCFSAPITRVDSWLLRSYVVEQPDNKSDVENRNAAYNKLYITVTWHRGCWVLVMDCVGTYQLDLMNYLKSRAVTGQNVWLVIQGILFPVMQHTGTDTRQGFEAGLGHVLAERCTLSSQQTCFVELTWLWEWISRLQPLIVLSSYLSQSQPCWIWAYEH